MSFFLTKGNCQTAPGAFTIAADTVTLTTTGTGTPDPGSPVMQWPYEELKNTLTNTSDTAIRYVWKMVSADLPAGWAITGFCDNLTCYAPNGVWETGGAMTSGPVAAGAPSPLWLHVAAPEHTADGSAVVRFAIQVFGQSDTITYVLVKNSVTGIRPSSVQEPFIGMYPNPAAEVMTVCFRRLPEHSFITIHDLNGRLCKRMPVPAGVATLQVPLGRMPAGTYVLSITDAAGRSFDSRRFIKQ